MFIELESVVTGHELEATSGLYNSDPKSLDSANGEIYFTYTVNVSFSDYIEKPLVQGVSLTCLDGMKCCPDDIHSIDVIISKLE